MPLRPWLRRYALAHPNARSSHREPTPQGGGIAVIVATVVVLAAAAALRPAPIRRRSAWCFAAVPFIALVGAADDIWTIERRAAPAAAGPRRRPDGRKPAGGASRVPMLPWWIERALLSCSACLWFVNLTNFMDGIDWMTVAEFVPLTIGLALHRTARRAAADGVVVGAGAVRRPDRLCAVQQAGGAACSSAMSAACRSGFWSRWLLVLLAGHGHLAAAIILPLYYLADATLTLLRRVANREPFWQSHRTHFYQRATERGFSVPAIVARVFVTNVVLVVLAAAERAGGRVRSVAAMTLGAAAVLVACLLLVFARGKP